MLMLLNFLLIFLQLFRLHQCAIANDKDLVPLQIVPNTTLYTGIYYKLALEAFPQGLITWVGTPSFNSIIVELNQKELPKYEPGEPYEIDSQWLIEPSEVTDQFTLRNGKKSLGFLSFANKEVGSGYYAAINEDPLVKKKQERGGIWRNNVLWKIKPDESGKYYILENVGKKGYTLTWTYTKHDATNYYIQIANYDPQDDAHVLFTPSTMNLKAVISSFEYDESPEAVFGNKKNQKQTLAAKFRFPNNSSATITQSLEETLEQKNSLTFSFGQSFSMMHQTEVEVGFLFAKAKATIKFEGGFQRSESKTTEETKKVVLRRDITIQPYTDVEASVYSVWANNVELPFTAQMTVTGTAERILADKPKKTRQGKIPSDVIESYMKSFGEDEVEVIERSGDSITVKLKGKLTGNIALESTVSTREVKKFKKV